MCNRNFATWLSTFKDSISTYDYYVDFAKVFANIDNIRIELNILNSLIGAKNIKNDFIRLAQRYPEILKCIPILLAVRDSSICVTDNNNTRQWSFVQTNYPIEDYAMFMEKSGLFDLISNHIIADLVDYVTGVETGLDSNGRKNRGGHLMEDLVERFIKQCTVNYYKELKTTEMERKWNIDLSTITNSGQAVKKFDFVVKTNSTIFAIETNFYTGGGSKLNETARSYKSLATASQNIPSFEFVWVTDGKGWHSARNNLKETFDVMKHLYNINDLQNGVLNNIF